MPLPRAHPAATAARRAVAEVGVDGNCQLAVCQRVQHHRADRGCCRRRRGGRWCRRARGHCCQAWQLRLGQQHAAGSKQRALEYTMEGGAGNWLTPAAACAARPGRCRRSAGWIWALAALLQACMAGQRTSAAGWLGRLGVKTRCRQLTLFRLGVRLGARIQRAGVVNPRARPRLRLNRQTQQGSEQLATLSKGLGRGWPSGRPRRHGHQQPAAGPQEDGHGMNSCSLATLCFVLHHTLLRMLSFCSASELTSRNHSLPYTDSARVVMCSPQPPTP